MDNDEAEVFQATRFATPPDLLTQRAYELAQQMSSSFGRGRDLIGQSAERGGAIMVVDPVMNAITTSIAQHYATGVMSQPRHSDPLETAINDPDVSIYEVIRLAEERA